ncbi:MAG: hypothetical protein WBE72_05885 [Terracidiphilus sp.]
MQLSADIVCAASTFTEARVELSAAWIPDPFEVCLRPELRLRGLAWGAFLSALLWTTLIFAGRALWSLWR